MANIIDSFTNIVTDKYALIKLFIWALPYFVSTILYINGAVVLANFIYLVTGVLFSGFCVDTTRRFLRGEEVTMPSILNPIPLLWTLLNTILACLPSVIFMILMLMATFWITSLFPIFKDNLVLFYVVFGMVYLILLSIVLISFLLYADDEKGKFYSAYNVVAIVKSLALMMVALLLFLIQSFILNIVLIALPGWGLYMVFGQNGVLYFYMSIVFALNCLIYAQYLGQIKHELVY